MTQTPDRFGTAPPSPGTTLWVYGYEMAVAGHGHRLPAIRGVIARENRAARRSVGKWTARLVLTHHTARVLVVSTRPDLDSGSNRRLEAELTALGVGFSVMVPMKVMQDSAPVDD
jgi:hypothetical protein